MSNNSAESLDAADGEISSVFSPDISTNSSGLIAERWTIGTSRLVVARPALLGLFLMLCAIVGMLVTDQRQPSYMQTVGFPVSLLIFLFAIQWRSIWWFMSSLLLGLSVWGVASLYGYGYLVVSPFRPSGYLSQLNGDLSGSYSRELKIDVSAISRAFNLSEPVLVRRNFGSTAEASAWLADSGARVLLLRGGTDWHQLVMSDVDRRDEEDLRLSPFIDESSGFSQIEIPLEGSTEMLRFVVFPEHFNIAANPAALARHFIAWFSDGMVGLYGIWTAGAGIGDWSRLEMSFLSAAEVDGYWLSREPLGVARLMLAVTQFLAVRQTEVDQSTSRCALENLQLAASMASRYEFPLVAAIIFNNAAIVTLAGSDGRDQGENQKVARLLKMAFELSRGKTATDAELVGSSAALYNLQVLRRLGVIE